MKNHKDITIYTEFRPLRQRIRPPAPRKAERAEESFMESIVGRLKNIASMQQFFVSPSGAAEDPSRSPLCAPVTAHPGGSFYGGRETKDERRGTKDGDTSFVTASPCHLPLQGKALRGDEGRGTGDGRTGVRPYGCRRILVPCSLFPSPPIPCSGARCAPRRFSPGRRRFRRARGRGCGGR